MRRSRSMTKSVPEFPSNAVEVDRPRAKIVWSLVVPRTDDVSDLPGDHCRRDSDLQQAAQGVLASGGKQRTIDREDDAGAVLVTNGKQQTEISAREPLRQGRPEIHLRPRLVLRAKQS